METIYSSRKTAGRTYLWLGLATSLLGPVLYTAQLHAKHLTVPWYVPILTTLGTLLAVVALIRSRSLWRILAVGLLGLLSACEWHFFTRFGELPAYAGAVAIGQPFPAFTTTLSDGSPFTDASLKDEPKTVMVFFRGRW
jgi:hypothetical protein